MVRSGVILAESQILTPEQRRCCCRGCPCSKGFSSARRRIGFGFVTSIRERRTSPSQPLRHHSESKSKGLYTLDGRSVQQAVVRAADPRHACRFRGRRALGSRYFEKSSENLHNRSKPDHSFIFKWLGLPQDKVSAVKLQTLTLAAKIFVLASTHDAIPVLTRYVFSLARYDLDYDVRDRARFLGSLLSGVDGGVFPGDDEAETDVGGRVILRQQQVKHVLFEGKVAPTEDQRWPGKLFSLHLTLRDLT